MKKPEWNGISKEYFILSVERFVAKIWHLKVWEKHIFHKIGSCTQLLCRQFALKSWFKIWKNEKGMAFLRNILFCLSDVSLQRYDSANRRPIWNFMRQKLGSLTRFVLKYFLGDFFFPYSIQHCFICRPSDSTVPTDAGIEPRTVATSALAVRRSYH